MCQAVFPSERRTHNVCTLLSSQILLCHKLFQLRRHAIISLITFYFDERSRHFFGKCTLYRVRRIFISILCIFWHELCLRPRRAPGPAGHSQLFCKSLLLLQPRLCMSDTRRGTWGFFLLTNPNATSVSSDSSNTRVKKDPEQSGVWMEGSCCKMLPQNCQAQAGTWKEIYILLITMVISHKHKFKE